jgi:hypothetical protein
VTAALVAVATAPGQRSTVLVPLIETPKRM